MFEWLLSAFTTVYGLGGVALAAGAVACLFYVPRVVPYLAFAAVACGGLGYVDRLQSDLDAAESAVTLADQKLENALAEAKRLATTAQADADEAKRLAADNQAQAEAYEADAAQTRSDRDELDLAKRAADAAAAGCKDLPAPIVGSAVHSALTGRTPSEDDPLAPSMRAAMEAIKAKGRHR